VEGKIANEVLNVREKVYSDEKISKKEFHTYSSKYYQNEDLCVRPNESYFIFQGVIRKDSPNGLTTDSASTFFLNNCRAFFLQVAANR